LPSALPPDRHAINAMLFFPEHTVMIIRTFKTILADESGATAIEYGLIAALVSVAAITALTQMGTSLRQMFNYVADNLNTAANATS